jgi:hypothetical protein
MTLREEVTLVYVCDGPRFCGERHDGPAYDGWDCLLALMLRLGWTETILPSGERGLFCPKCSGVTA